MHEVNIRYGMPLGYGPPPGPRQTAPSGEQHAGWEKVKTTTATVLFKAPREILATFLPHKSFTIDAGGSPGDESYASIVFTRLENLPWLAGRGYNHCGFYVHDVVCPDRDEQVRGKYLSVLFENRADPIITGREQLGYAKVFATLDEVRKNDELVIGMGWEGSTFGTMTLNGLQEVSPPSVVDTLPDSFAPSQGLLHFKCIPKTGGPGYDAMYPTFTPGSLTSMSTTKHVETAASAKLEFMDLGCEKLPTLHHIATRLASLPTANIVHAGVIESVGSTDVSGQRAIALSGADSVLEEARSSPVGI
ncbi:uncharacterized protein AB675_6155 [Cyphellophora attinorum]|uniref:Acetoacetate decarboxylase n=1 Tax=Cyphellophora attinorum TaxID=1664694 RepID=A0A0N1P2P4_9EURO|nr:uncharacterized protein AB675_6155 [Phialophora attinorum]KPI44173.1 hypothetical protein AB675_6155 [Phialophora attinorum]